MCKILKRQNVSERRHYILQEEAIRMTEDLRTKGNRGRVRDIEKENHLVIIDP